MMTHYTTDGSVRGECGHKHRAPETAQACIDRDGDGCASQGGYSDRRIVAVEDGSRRLLMDDEHEWLDSMLD